ncbi:MAG: hypothetical protein FJX76_03425, partial [Armatimonadetes bacterium]|nr:hypothetical protein [Armatimonadota bacterium]
DHNLVHNIKSAKRMVERVRPEVWDVLEEVIKDHPVLLNRAPTLHRLGIQAFEPVLVEGKAIQIHPLVCTPYNADFDGDQMAVHLPLSAGAQAEARILMLSANNILLPSFGNPAMVPTQDMVLGVYYLTIDKHDSKGQGKRFSNLNESLMAYWAGEVELQAPIRVRYALPTEPSNLIRETTIGRLILNQHIQDAIRPTIERAIEDARTQYAHQPEMPEQPEVGDKQESGVTRAIRDAVNAARNAEKGADTDEIIEKFLYRVLNEPFLNDTVNKKAMMRLVSRIHRRFGNAVTARLLDQIKDLGFGYATRSGNTIGVDDIQVPPEKPEILRAADKKVEEAEYFYRKGLLTTEEQRRLLTGIWLAATNQVEEAMMRHLDRLNPVYMMATSGARGNPAQVKQIAGMRGLMADPSGKIITVPIRANLREGLSVLEYFISTHGARKGLADTALRTADSGYLTRRLIDVSQDVIIRETDCHTEKGIRIEAVEEGGDVMVRLGERISGRVAAEDIVVDETGEVLCPIGEECSDEVGDLVEKAGGILVEARADVIRGRVSARNVPVPRKESELIVREGERISEESAKEIINAGISHVRVKSVAIRSVLTCDARFGICTKCYGRNLATGKPIEIGETVGIIAAQSIGEPGTQLTLRTFHTGGVASEDIISGLPRVEELFEARKPKGSSPIAEHEGIVSITEEKRMRKIVVKSTATGQETAHPVPFSSRRLVEPGDHVDAGEQLVDGALNPHDVLRVRGVDDVQKYLVNEVQRVYRSQGVDINDKHVEVIVRQMLRKVRLDDAGDTKMLPGALVDLAVVREETRKLQERRTTGEEVAVPTYKPVLMGVTKASLATDSFLSAASFQETTRVLTEAAINGRKDPLLGLKENVIIGKLIPAGTGMPRYRNVEIEMDHVEPEPYYTGDDGGIAEWREEDDEFEAQMSGAEYDERGYDD